ncbi:hypothetical protein [Aquibacillus sediminis]|uniref:hypothetical protein n=1 Tax=Aquibacillus sediminis TaxID=2574734 RepID=UPI0011082AF9|nr:hypothetical protein [Aquibacillus sediminis]
MRKLLPILFVTSVLLNSILLFFLYTENVSEREEKELLITQYVENLSVIAANFNDLTLELSNRENGTVNEEFDIYKTIANDLKESDTLLHSNEEMYLNNVDEEILSPSMRALNMEGLGYMPMIWSKFLDGEIEQELSNIKAYNSLLNEFFEKLSETDFQNAKSPKEMTQILKDVSSELVPQN